MNELDELIERRSAEIMAEARAGAAAARLYINRSTGQALRFIKERITNRGSINERKRMATSTKKVSECPNVTLNPCKSSQIHSYGYCDKTNTLAMQFHQKGGASAVYHYPFSPEQFADLEKAESKGKHFGKHIKSLDCCKLVPDEQAA